MFKIQYWNIRYEDWVDLTGSIYHSEAEAEGGCSRIASKGFRRGGLRIVPADTTRFAVLNTLYDGDKS